MLYGADHGQPGEEAEAGLAHEIDMLIGEKVQIVIDLLECMQGIIAQGDKGREDRRQLTVRQNRLEAQLFDFADKVDELLDGIEDEYCNTQVKLVPALKDLGL